jgi:hypothetical protein
MKFISRSIKIRVFIKDVNYQMVQRPHRNIAKKNKKNPRSTHFYKNKNIILPPSASTLTPKKWARGRGIAGVDYLQSTR